MIDSATNAVQSKGNLVIICGLFPNPTVAVQSILPKLSKIRNDHGRENVLSLWPDCKKPTIDQNLWLVLRFWFPVPTFSSCSFSMSDLSLSILMPVYNEENTIAEVIDRVLAIDVNLKELVIVDDGSKDDTVSIIHELAKSRPKIKFFPQPKNKGKTAAIKGAIGKAHGGILIVQDADLEYDPDEIPAGIDPILRGRADVVYGSRFLVRRAARVLYFYHFLANKFLTFLSNFLTNRNMSDIETCYKAFRSQVIKPLQLTSSRFGMEVEITAMICKTRARTYEVPISYYGRTYEEGKKIAMRDGFAAIYYIMFYNLIKSRTPSGRKYIKTVNEAIAKIVNQSGSSASSVSNDQPISPPLGGPESQNKDPNAPLTRVLEEEYMDSPEEATGYDTMDHSAVNELFANDLLGEEAELGDVLDLGTGTAQIPVVICDKSESCRIMAGDAAASMLDLALYNLEAAGHTERIQLTQIDAKNLEMPDETFDTVISNSIIHHIPEPIECLKEAVRVCKEGGLLFFRDLMRPDSGAEVSELVEKYAGNENEYQQKMFDDSLRAALSLDEIQSYVESLGFEKSTVAATSDRHWTWVATKPASKR